MLRFLLLLVLCVTAALLWLAWGVWRRARFDRRVRSARSTFARRRAELEQRFFEIAAASGKPRGLAWKSCDFHDDPLFALDRTNSNLYALVGVTIGFSAIEGGDMEEVEAVGNLRCATAVFIYRDRTWSTDGRAVFNLEPRETLDRYRDSLEPLGNSAS